MLARGGLLFWVFELVCDSHRNWFSMAQTGNISIDSNIEQEFPRRSERRTSISRCLLWNLIPERTLLGQSLCFLVVLVAAFLQSQDPRVSCFCACRKSEARRYVRPGNVVTGFSNEVPSWWIHWTLVTVLACLMVACLLSRSQIRGTLVQRSDVPGRIEKEWRLLWASTVELERRGQLYTVDGLMPCRWLALCLSTSNECISRPPNSSLMVKP